MQPGTRFFCALVLTAVVCIAAPTQAAQQVALLPLAANDLAADQLSPPEKRIGVEVVSREPLHFSWSLDPLAALEVQPPLATATSREYWLQTDAATLNAGLEVHTVSPAALIRINPAGPVGSDEDYAIHPLSLTVETPDGQRLSDGAAMQTMATAEQLAAAGAPFAEGTSAFRLRHELGSGRFVLRAAELEASEDPYVVHIFEPQSAVSLVLSTVSSTLEGRSFTARAELRDGDTRMHVTGMQGSVVSPSGARLPVLFEPAGRHSFQATLMIGDADTAAPGLWEVHASVQTRSGELTVIRNVRTAFSCALPTARLSGTAAVAVAPFAVRFGIETAAAGRYELRGLLYATSAAGELLPVALAHSADWLEAGGGEIDLVFDRATLSGPGLGAPYEIHDLQLRDQARMGILHKQARALVID